MRPDFRKINAMKGWIIYPRYISMHADNAFDWMRDEAARYGISLSVLFFEDLASLSGAAGGRLLHEGRPVDAYPDFIIARGYDREISCHFELRGIPVINSTEAMFLSKDKLLSAQVFAREELPIPLTMGGTPEEWNYNHLSRIFGADRFIVKDRYGAKGENVFLVDSEALMREAVRECGGNCIAQEFIAESSGRDLRVWVIGGKAEACVMRKSDNSFKANFSQGGHALPYGMTAEIAALAERSAAICGLEFAGVDLLFGQDGPVLCEVNGNAGFRTLSQVGGNDIPSKLFAYIRKRYEN